MTKRTTLQNASLHKYFQTLADTLNDGGYDIKKTLRQDFEIPWTGTLIKELIWREVQIAMTGKESTTELDTTEVDQIYLVLTKHLGEKLGVYVPFPSEEGELSEKLN